MNGGPAPDRCLDEVRDTRILAVSAVAVAIYLLASLLSKDDGSRHDASRGGDG